MCSDGLHGVVPEPDLIATLAASNSIEEKCQRLIALAKERGGPDNITAVLLKVS